MNTTYGSDGGSRSLSFAEKERRRQNILNNKDINIWQKKHMLDKLDKDSVSTYGNGNSDKQSANLFGPRVKTNGATTAGSGLPANQRNNNSPRKAVPGNAFTYLDKDKLAKLKKKDPSTLTMEDYVSAWEKQDWDTTSAYVDAVNSGKLPKGYMTYDQASRLQNATIDQMPGWVKEPFAAELGFGNGFTMNMLENAVTKNKSPVDYSGDLARNAIDRFKNESPYSYHLGEFIGQDVSSIYTGGAAGTALKAIKNPLIRDAAIGAATGGIPTFISDINKGVKPGDAALHSLENAAYGTMTGVGLYALGQALPMPGTIPYYKMQQRGGMSATLAPHVGRLARVLNPEGAAAVDNAKIGNRWNGGYSDKYSFDSKYSLDKLQRYDIAQNAYFKKKSIPGDNLEGHEVWQHANIKSQGLATNRLSTETSKNNPVIVLDNDTHARITNDQRAFDAANQASLDNIDANYRLLLQYDIPEVNASWAQIMAQYQANKAGGR